MTAYVIVQVEVTDPELFEQYRTQVPQVIAAYGGKYLVRGGAYEVLAGEWSVERTVMLEFPSMERAKAWHDSPEYAGPRAIRDRAAKVNLVVVEGVAG